MFGRFINTLIKGIFILLFTSICVGIFMSTVKFTNNSFWNICGGIQIGLLTCLGIGGIINAFNYLENHK